MYSNEKLIEGYRKAISNMDLSIVYPFTETEIQPLYSNIWVDYIYELFLNFKKEDCSVIEKLILNKSILRSMLIMDLFDIYFSGAPNYKKEPIIHFYKSMLNFTYKEDCCSLYQNTPNFYDRIEAEYFKNKYIDLVNKIYGICLAYSYKRYQDIYADNCYEVIGPYKSRDYKYILNKFHIEGREIILYFIYEKFRIMEGGIDLFGHCTYNPPDFYALSLDKNFITSSDEMQNLFQSIKKSIDAIPNITDTYELKILNFENRFLRYEKLFSYYNINVDKNKIYKLLEYPKHDRILDKNNLLYIIKKSLEGVNV